MPAAPSPTARALLALEVLQASPGITADRLADRLGVTERAARRYVGILREAGIPVESVRGRYGGYRVGRGLRLPPLTFAANEALALVMAVLDGHHSAAGTAAGTSGGSDPEYAADPVGAALGKILRALPAAVAAQAQAVRQGAAPAPDRAAARPDPATTTVLVQACADRRRVRLDYRSEAGSEWTAEVDPWAVVVRHGRWYLLCRSSEEVRAYRVDRMARVEALDAPAEVPDDLDAVAVLEDHLSTGWEYQVEVLVQAPIDVVRRTLPRAVGRAEAADDTTSRVVGTTGNPYWCAERLVALPAPFSVIGGPELRRAVAELGRRLVAAVEGGGA